MSERPEKREWSGSLARIPLPEVLTELRRDRASGTLFCVRGATSRMVRLRDGLPGWVNSNEADDGFVAYLFRRGEVGIDEAFITSPGSCEALHSLDHERAHAVELLLDLFSWGDGAFLWVSGGLVESERALGLSFAALVTRGLERVSRVASVRAGAGPLDLRLEAHSDLDPSVVRELSDETCLVLGAVRNALPPQLDGEIPWPSDFRTLLGLWQLRLLGLIRPTRSCEGVTVGSLLVGHKMETGLPPVARLDAVGLMTPAPMLYRPPTAPQSVPPIPAPASFAARPATGPQAVPTITRPITAPQSVPAASSRPAGTPLVASTPGVELSARTGTQPAAPPSRPAVARLEEPLEPRHGVTVTGLDAKDLARSGQPNRSPQEAASEWFKSGERFLKELDLHNAITSFRQAVELSPNNPEYLYRLGTTLVRNPRWRKEAEEHLLKATELLPWDPKARLALAKLYVEGNLPKRAEAMLKAVLESDPDHAAARRELADLLKKPRKSGAAGAGAALLGRIGLGRDAGSGSSEESEETLEENPLEV